jgi:hypothetical protein
MTVTHRRVVYVLRTAADVLLLCTLLEQLEALAAGKAA